MTLVLPPGYATVLHSLRMTGDADPYAITYGIDTTVTDAAGANTVAANLHGAYDAWINPNNPSLLTLIETVIKVNAVALDPPIIGVATTPFAGLGGSTAIVPQNTALLVHKRTSFGGQTGRGRMYFPALNEANVDSIGQISAGWISTMNTALAGWLAEIAGLADVGEMQLLHDSAGAGSLLDPFPVTSLAVDSLAATQRRRLRH